MQITKKAIDQLKTAKDGEFYWDDKLKGFGIKVYKSGRKVFVVQGRLNGKIKRYTIGAYGNPWAPDEARKKSMKILSQLNEGIDPTAEKRKRKLQGSLSTLAEQYLTEIMVLKKERTQSLEKSILNRHILPLLGKKPVASITKRDLQQFMIKIEKGVTAVDEKTKFRGRAIVKGGPGVANRSLAILSSLFNYAIECDIRHDNPTIGVKKYNLKKHDRFLSETELLRLGKALVEAEKNYVSQYAIAAIRFMILTGCRSGEALSLEWQWIDYKNNIAKLPDSKTGYKILLIGSAAMQLLKGINKLKNSPLVFPSSVGGKTPISIQKVWRKIRTSAKLEDLRIHDLRHNFASTGVSSGNSIYIVGKLLGHTQNQTTERYAHLAPDPIKQAANDISTKLAEQIYKHKSD